jgi:hypothetical protein
MRYYEEKKFGTNGRCERGRFEAWHIESPGCC